ncbi:MAG TPA: phosphoribosylformylglycinamidine synthase subunit PurQ [Eudoraea sp.]|nr:phosphoribosylformylglycinamidine synthase subunit PurQ [Eudoraea sp.]
MKQKYRDEEVIAPGTVIISAAGHCNGITKVVEPVLQKEGGEIYYINLSKDAYKLGGSSFAQVLNAIGNESPTVADAAYVRNVFNTLQALIKKGQILAGHDVGSGGLITTLLELCYADLELGAELDLTALNEPDTIKLLFSENAGVVFQGRDAGIKAVLKEAQIDFKSIGKVQRKAILNIKNDGVEMGLNVAALRDTWYKTSFLLDNRQTAEGLARVRFENYKTQPLTYQFPQDYANKLPFRVTPGLPRPRAAILREKGSNSEREMANAMYLAGFDVRDVHMTDLITGRETLSDVQFIGAVGGFSNSDVLGSAKGWAGAFKYNDKANTALKNFFARKDTLSIGICNGCQLFMELDLINPDHDIHGRLTYNDSGKHESNFTSVKIQENNSVMLSALAGSTLGIWVSHGEGKFTFPYPEDKYNIVATYGYASYPANPNGSDFNTAMMCDATGRHLVTMPHLERSIFPWNWAYYPADRDDKVSPWLEAFVNARKWVEEHKKLAVSSER